MVVNTCQELIMRYIVEVHRTMVSTELQQLEVSTQRQIQKCATISRSAMTTISGLSFTLRLSKSGETSIFTTSVSGLGINLTASSGLNFLIAGRQASQRQKNRWAIQLNNIRDKASYIAQSRANIRALQH